MASSDRAATSRVNREPAAGICVCRKGCRIYSDHEGEVNVSEGIEAATLLGGDNDDLHCDYSCDKEGATSNKVYADEDENTTTKNSTVGLGDCAHISACNLSYNPVWPWRLQRQPKDLQPDDDDAAVRRRNVSNLDGATGNEGTDADDVGVWEPEGRDTEQLGRVISRAWNQEAVEKCPVIEAAAEEVEDFP